MRKMFNSKRLAIYALTVFLYLGNYLIDSFPEPQNQGFGIQTGNNDPPFRPGERRTIQQYFASNYIDVNRADASGNTALMVAAIHGYEVFARLLIERGAHVNLANRFGDTPLHFAAGNGFPGVINVLIQGGAYVDAINSFNDTALHFAANNGHEDVVKLLIRLGANVNAVSKNGYTPLMLAAYTGKEKVVRTLLENNADRSIENFNRKTVKDIAADRGHKRIADLFQTEPVARRGSYAQQACDWYQKDSYDRILGGEQANSGEFPWMVALGYLNPQYKISFDCGGTIISNYFVMTAAHCATTSRRPVVVRIGKLTLSDVDDNYNMRAKDRQVENVIQHPKFVSSTKKNDIALIKVIKPIEFSNDVGPACLNLDIEDQSQGLNLTVTGWGLTSPEKRERPNELLKANLTTVPLSECNNTVLEFNKMPNLPAFRSGLDNSQYCAFDPNGVKDSCQGDSGGPLQIYPHGVPIARVVGIVSFGVSCGSAWPGIYTRVAHYVDWIESHVWPNGFNATSTANSGK